MKDTVYENDISDELEPFSKDSRKDSILIPIKGKEIYIKQLPLYVLCNYETEEATVTEKKMTNPKKMTVKEVAETGVLSEYALRQLIKEDRLPVLRMTAIPAPALVLFGGDGCNVYAGVFIIDKQQ